MILGNCQSVFEYLMIHAIAIYMGGVVISKYRRRKSLRLAACVYVHDIREASDRLRCVPLAVRTIGLETRDITTCLEPHLSPAAPLMKTTRESTAHWNTILVPPHDSGAGGKVCLAILSGHQTSADL